MDGRLGRPGAGRREHSLVLATTDELQPYTSGVLRERVRPRAPARARGRCASRLRSASGCARLRRVTTPAGLLPPAFATASGRCALILNSTIGECCGVRGAAALQVLCATAALALVGGGRCRRRLAEHSHDKGGDWYSPLGADHDAERRAARACLELQLGRDRATRQGLRGRTSEQSIPILVAGRLVLCAPFHRIARARSGHRCRARWAFDPEVDTRSDPGPRFKCRRRRAVGRRGSAWRPRKRASCSPRATCDLIAIDARNGRRCAGFGANGEVALQPDRPLAFKGELSRFSVPAIVNGTIVLGLAHRRRTARPPRSGDVQAFDARTGARRWTFDPIPRDAARPGLLELARRAARRIARQRQRSGGTWRVDEKRDLVFLLDRRRRHRSLWVGSVPGDNRYANSIVALRGATGDVVWHFRSFTTRSGTTTLPRNHCSSTCRANGTTGARARAEHEAGPGLRVRTARPENRSSRSRNARSRAATCRESGTRRAQPFPLKPPPLVCHRARHPTMRGALPGGTGARVAG